MSEMIERVARAMVARRGLPEGAAINWESFRADARVAIEAMRDVDERTFDAAWFCHDFSRGLRPTGFKAVYQSMIDAALLPRVSDGSRGAGETTGLDPSDDSATAKPGRPSIPVSLP